MCFKRKCFDAPGSDLLACKWWYYLARCAVRFEIARRFCNWHARFQASFSYVVLQFPLPSFFTQLSPFSWCPNHDQIAVASTLTFPFRDSSTADESQWPIRTNSYTFSPIWPSRASKGAHYTWLMTAKARGPFWRSRAISSGAITCWMLMMTNSYQHVWVTTIAMTLVTLRTYRMKKLVVGSKGVQNFSGISHPGVSIVAKGD